MRIVFGGTPDVAIPSLDSLVDSRHELVAVVTRPDAPSGRGKKLTASPVAQYAAKLGLEILKPQRPRDEEFVSRLTEIAPECCPVVAYGALVVATLMDAAPEGAGAAVRTLPAERLTTATDVLRVLADLRPMSAVGPIGLDEARRVLTGRLLTVEAEPPSRRFGRVFGKQIGPGIQGRREVVGQLAGALGM